MRLSDTPSMLLLVFVAVVDEMITAPEPIGQCAARSSSLAGMIGTSAAKRQTIHACQVIKKSILDQESCGWDVGSQQNSPRNHQENLHVSTEIKRD